MEAPSVVEGLEVIEERSGGGTFGVEGEAIAEDFRLEGSKGAFRKSVVITIAFGTHALAQAMSGKQLAGDGGGILATAIGVKDCTPGHQARVRWRVWRHRRREPREGSQRVSNPEWRGRTDR